MVLVSYGSLPQAAPAPRARSRFPYMVAGIAAVAALALVGFAAVIDQVWDWVLLS
jgi:hypothetical protein